MSSGITERMKELSRRVLQREKVEWKPRERDRSLNGKARIRARKEAQRAERG